MQQVARRPVQRQILGVQPGAVGIEHIEAAEPQLVGKPPAERLDVQLPGELLVHQPRDQALAGRDVGRQQQAGHRQQRHAEQDRAEPGEDAPRLAHQKACPRPI